MKDVVFFTPNVGMESAAKFILATLNTGGPPRFNAINFKLIDEDRAKCASLYSTNYKAGHSSLLSLETVRVNSVEKQKFFLMVVLRVQSLRGSTRSRTMVPLPEEHPRFPAITRAWQEKIQTQLGHKTMEDLWSHLLDVEKISRMPL